MNSFTSCGGVNDSKNVINVPQGIVVNYNNGFTLIECDREDVESILGHKISIKICNCGCVFIQKKLEYKRYDHDDPISLLLIRVTSIPYKLLHGMRMVECHIWGSICIHSVLKQTICELCVKFKKKES